METSQYKSLGLSLQDPPITFVCHFKKICSNVRVCFRGFFRGDSLIGTALVKLQPLETKCMLHESFDLMDGRKTVGGKLEVKVRLRNPIQAKQVERVEEKWLVIDH
ncbi:hypothetical protein J6590_069785 [Homalodisca vitripennis]|nr:hypothetical protein J6590_069785 [Homalodisca vitripennis]